MILVRYMKESSSKKLTRLELIVWRGVPGKISTATTATLPSTEAHAMTVFNRPRVHQVSIRSKQPHTYSVPHEIGLFCALSILCLVG